jgi:hypothetical protein
MQDLKARFKKLDSAFNALIAEHQLLRKEKLQWQAQQEEWQALEESRKNEIEKLKAELNSAKLAQGLQGQGQESELTKAKLSSLMREIDRCIASLNE